MVWRGNHPLCRFTPNTSARPLPWPLTREQEETTGKGKAASQGPSLRGTPALRWWPQGSSDPWQGPPSREVSLSSPRTTLVRAQAPEPAVPQPSPGATPVWASSTSPVGGRLGLHSRDRAGRGWAFGAGLLGDLWPSS